MNMKICLNHEWGIVESQPNKTYFDYDGNMVLIYKCRCKKCGKEKNRKFLGKHVGHLFDAIPPCAKIG